MTVNRIINSIVEIVLVSLIPFIWWLVTARKKESFFKWIGIKGIEKEHRQAVIKNTLFITLVFMLVSVFTLYILKDTETATSEFKGLGIGALLPALIYAVFNTSFPEEIFFRGFLLKRLSYKLGYNIANLIQSIVFGLLHGVMFFSLVGVIKAIIIVLFTSAVAFSMGYVNEKKAQGSILPSWFIHAVSNIFASIIAMFSFPGQ